jgi:hypothetical protein
MALTFGDFLSIFTTNDASGGRAIKATFDSGIDDIENYLTKSDPAGGRAIKVVNVGAPLGPQFWTEAYTATTQATSSWTPTGAATNINAAIIPKGTGAILAQIPDGAITGGNARGVNAVDFQRARPYGANRVATGERSFIGNGENNSVSGRNSAVLSGDNNGVSGNNSAVVTGTTNTIAGADCRSFIGGGNLNSITSFPGSVGIVSGQTNTSNANYAFIGGGQSNTASGQWSSVIGGQNNTASQNYAIAGGSNCTASGSSSVALGGSCSTNSECGIAIGRNCTANGPGQRGIVAMGNYSSAGTDGGVAIGMNCSSTNFYAVALGNSGASGDSSFAAGRSTASGANSFAVGRETVSNLHGQFSHSSGRFSANGDAQAHELIWRNAITGTATTELFLDGSSAAAILPSTNAIWHGVIDVAAVCTAAGDGSTAVGAVEASSFKVTIKRIGTTTSLVGTVQEIGTVNADASMATSVVTIDNNDTNESLRIQFTPPGTAGSTTVIRVVATFRGLQIQY